MKRLLCCLALLLAGCHGPHAAPATPASVRAAIHEAFDDMGLYDKAVRVAYCESRLDPNAVSSGGTYVGLFQLGSNYIPTVRFYNGTGDRKDPRGNALAARDSVVQRGDWSAFPNCGRA